MPVNDTTTSDHMTTPSHGPDDGTNATEQHRPIICTDGGSNSGNSPHTVKGELDMSWTSDLKSAWEERAWEDDDDDDADADADADDSDTTADADTTTETETDTPTMTPNTETDSSQPSNSPLARARGETVAGTSDDDFHDEQTVALPSSANEDTITPAQREAVETAVVMPNGTQQDIADAAGVSTGTVSMALTEHYPAHQAVTVTPDDADDSDDDQGQERIACHVCGKLCTGGKGLGRHYTVHTDDIPGVDADTLLTPNTEQFRIVACLVGAARRLPGEQVRTRLKAAGHHVPDKQKSRVSTLFNKRDLLTRARDKDTHGQPYRYGVTDEARDAFFAMYRDCGVGFDPVADALLLWGQRLDTDDIDADTTTVVAVDPDEIGGAPGSDAAAAADTDADPALVCTDCGTMFDTAAARANHENYCGQPWHDADRLDRLYHDDDLSPDEIADRFDVSVMTIEKWLDRLDVVDADTNTNTNTNTGAESDADQGGAAAADDDADDQAQSVTISAGLADSAGTRPDDAATDAGDPETDTEAEADAEAEAEGAAQDADVSPTDRSFDTLVALDIHFDNGTPVTAPELARYVDYSGRTVHRHLYDLSQAGVVEMKTVGNSDAWWLPRDHTDADGDTGTDADTDADADDISQLEGRVADLEAQFAALDELRDHALLAQRIGGDSELGRFATLAHDTLDALLGDDYGRSDDQESALPWDEIDL